MSDVRARLADALRRHRFIPGDLVDGCQGCSWEGIFQKAHADHLAEVLRAEFDIRERITVDTSKDFELPWA